MKTLTANRFISREELVSILEKGLSHEYKYELVDENQERYVLVKKNALVGAKIFNVANKISIEGVTPTLGGYLFVFAATFYTGMFLGVPQPWLDFEKSVGTALVKELQ
ncbi:hypothetical protein J2Y45_000423 [Dyadobacter sp. BE34]|uniref:Uncharacterized protein n=1 Tax=Dyadobacter fermentans TaxID=94254 RepID=A0ABU1QPX6_9BACT|nr:MULTISPECIES: hypothetical protein [Dyadobacter]MDR6803153.1 hypothetical protein [Dyadobacter fermentans]MDR7040894.1 hypothetical protein [Dyadobacter sp. BE242]MDR7195297.1 hypothetical protein [Dyadobacter sp. BE34]MDR7214157.1 hypothetical protein [Dyadobacter sp. BE31]MDR7260704.1 hypothetical protein [Dyadobacter sp. BE32]